MVGIYKLFIGENIYIGKSIKIESRIKTHLSNLNNKCHCNKYLQRVYDKYGIDSDIVEECSKEILNEREKYWIEYYRNLNYNVLNMTDGGDGGDTFKLLDIEKKQKIIEISREIGKRNKSPEEILKSAKSRIGQKRTPEQIERIRKSHIGKEPWNKGNKKERLWVINSSGVSKIINKSELEEYTNNGYIVGRLYNGVGVKITPWNKGKTKYTDDRIKNMAENMKGNTRCMTRFHEYLGIQPGKFKKTLHRFFIEGVNSILDNNYCITKEIEDKFNNFYEMFIENCDKILGHKQEIT